MMTFVKKALRQTASPKALIMALMVVSCMIASGAAEAEQTPANTNTTMKAAPNGVPVENIANPNAAGVSNNLFNTYNVDSKGLIVNNQDSSKMQVQSQLGGAVAANSNLTKEATVIINQVVTTNRSVLAGYTELIGGSADLIVANPNGITCSGCGFINISNLTMTTGVPVIANNGAGALTGFNLNKGDILITGAGMDASTTDYVALFARSLSLQGQMNAKYLDIVAGANNIDYATKTATAQAGTGTAPTLAIDSSALGGMYADRIRLIATEAGVGVHMLGDVSTGAGDFTLTSAGKVDLENHISTQGDLNVTSTSNSGTDDIALTDALFVSQGALSLTANSGNIHLKGGLLMSVGNMTLQSASLTDESDTNSLTDNNTRYASGNLTLNQTGAATLNGTVFGTARTLAANVNSLSLGASEGLESTGGDVTVTGATLTNAGTITSDTSNLTVNATDTLTNSGTLNAGNDLTLNVLNNLTNSSNILASHDITISRTGTGGTTGYLEIYNNTASGAMQAGRLFTIEGVSGDHAVNLDANAGYLLAPTFAFDTHNLTNSNYIQSSTGASTISVSGTLTNNTTGNINLGTVSSASGTINADTITDNNIIQSSGALNINVGTSVTTATANAGTTPATPAGQIVSAGDLTFRGLTASNYTINNGGIIQSVGGTLDIAGHGGGSAVNINNTSSVAAAIYEGSTVNWNANNISFTGNGVKADNGLTISANSLNLTNSSAYAMAGDTGTLTINSLTTNGAIYAPNNLTINSPSITVGSTGALAASGTGTLQINLTGGSGSLDNSGALYAGSQLNIGTNSGVDTTNYTGTFTNEVSGTVNSGGDAFFGVNTFTNNSPNFNIAHDAIINANTFNNNIPGTYVITWDYLQNATCLAHPTECFDGSEGSGRTSSNLAFAIPDGAQDSRAGAQSDDHNTTAGGIQVDDWHFVDLNGNPIGGAYSDDTEHTAGVPTDETARYLATFDVKQQYVGTAPSASNKPNMIVGNSLTIENFQNATNRGGDISAPNVTIKTTKGGTFTNDDLSLHQQNWEAWWDEYSPCGDRQVDSCGWNNQRSYDKWINSTTTISSFGAGIFATNLTATGFNLVNEGSSQAYTITAKTAPTTGTGTVVSNPSNNSISFGGITVNLPTNSNGLFVVNLAACPAAASGATTCPPGIGPLIESNPKYKVGSPFLGSDYMLKTYGVDPDTVERRLGDANYEAQLIQQQLVGVGASQLLGTTNTAAAMQQLMDNGASQGKSLGLKIGVAPTAAQIANLSSNMVWMVDTVVQGQHVLAPVVYLSATTRSQIASGAVISATNANMQLTSLTNNGGTISGSSTLNVTTTGDITNTSGTIKGGNVSLTSTGGNITNQTLANFANGTNLSQTGTISSTGDLALNANKNLVNTGAQLTAGGNASLTAGGNIDFNTIKDVQNSGSVSQSSSILGDSSSVTMTTTVTNVGSGLKVGGNLTSNSGGNTNLTNANINVTGNGSMTAGGNLNIMDAQNTKTTTTTSSQSGLGVGGGVYGSEDINDTDIKGTSAASNIHFGGNGNLTANGGTITVQGSNVDTGGNLGINAQTVNVLAGQNTDQHTRTVTTTTYLSTGSNSASGSSGTNTSYQPTKQQQNMGQTETGAAGANASANETANGKDLSLVDHKTTTTNDDSSTAVGSSLKSGGNLTINSTGDTTLVGANVDAGGNANLNAGGNLNIEAAQNTHTVTTNTTDTNVGFFTSSQNNASAGANAGYNNSSNGSGSQTNDVGNVTGGSSSTTTGNASTGAQASSDNKLDLVRVDQSSSTTTDITHTGTTIHSGGNTTLGATNDINIAGSSVNAGGDLTANAGNNLNVTAVQDSHTVTSSDSKTSAGFYADAGANANASASGIDGSKYGGVDTQASASASADANAGVGIEASNTTSGDTHGSTTAVTSSLTSGGNMTRTATGTITDQGTQINAGGNFTQTAATWNSEAAQNTTFSSTDSTTNTAKLGLYADANASKSASYDQNMTQQGNDPSASVGVSANYARDTAGASSATSNAVVSNIHAGGNFTSTTTGASSLEGTNVDAGGDLTLKASSLDYKAAQNTASSSNSNGNINVGLKVGKGTNGYTADLSGGASQLGTSSSSSTAVVGSLKSGNNLTVNTSGDQTYEGTNITAGNGATVQSTGGNVTFNAAQNTNSTSKNYEGFSGDINGNQKGGGLSFDGGMNNQNSASSTAVVSNVSAGSGGLTVKANNALTMQGTNLNSGGDVTLGAKTLDYQAAQNTSSSSQATQTLDVSASGSSKGGSKSGGGSGSYVNTDTSKSSTTAVTGNINATGNLKVTTSGDQTYTGTNITAGKDATISSTGGAVNFNQAQNTSNSSSTQWGVSASASGSSGGKGGDSKQGAIGGGYQTNTSATTTGVASNIKTGGNLNVTSNNDLTLQGTNINAGGDASLQSNNGSVNYQALKSTATGSGWGVNAGISGSSSSGGKGGDSSSKGGQIGGNYSTQNDVTETAGSITSGGAVTVKGNQDVTLVGTNVTSTGKTTLAATNGNVNIDATKSTQNDQSYAASIGVSKTSSGGGSTAKNNTGYKGGVNVDVNETSTETGATIKAGSLDISSGKDTNMTGTNIATTGTGDTNINAGGNVNMAAAESTYGGVNLNVTMVQSNKIPGLSGGKILPPQNAGVKGGADYQGVNINSGGNLNVSSGGSTTMQATQVTTGGAANIDAAGGLNKTSTTSGGIDVGYKLSLKPTGTASLDLPSTSDTKITAKGGSSVTNTVPLNTQQIKTITTGLTSGVTTVTPQLQTNLTKILNNASLSTADKFNQMTNAIKNDPNLSSSDKTAMLNALAQQQKNVGGAKP